MLELSETRIRSLTKVRYTEAEDASLEVEKELCRGWVVYLRAERESDWRGEKMVFQLGGRTVLSISIENGINPIIKIYSKDSISNV